MRTIVLLLGTLFLIGCNQAQESIGENAVLIQNVNIIDVTDGSILENRNVVIDSGKIKKISNQKIELNSAKLKIDGTGKYLMPGLAEMHAHIPSPSAGEKRINDVLYLYLANGITTIRGMLGHPSHLSLREKAESGALLSPKIFTSSPSLNGNSVPSMEEAESKVKAYKNQGYDFLKIHPGIQLEVFDKIVETANEVNIPFAGHVPVDVGIRHALHSKFASIDHVDGYLEGLVPESANVNPSDNGFFGFKFTPLVDPSLIGELVLLSKENKVWVVSTQSLFTRWFSPISADLLLQQAEMKYMPEATLDTWKERKNASIDPTSGFNEKQWDAFISVRKKLIKQLQEKGHGMLLGSDAPQLFNVPGFSIHHEISALSDAGLSPLEIIQSGTLHPAQYFGIEKSSGQVLPGFEADLILLDSNPIEDLSALKDPHGVIRQGKWMDRSFLAAGLKKIADNP